jgi:hypothetical protein
MIRKPWFISSRPFHSLRGCTSSVMFGLSLAAVLTMALAPISVTAQTTRPTDTGTPSGLAPGSPVGSYSLSDFENINLFNGGLNFSLPILPVVGGRGGAGYAMRLNIQQRWMLSRVNISDFPIQFYYLPEGSWQVDRGPDFSVSAGAGSLTARMDHSPRCFSTPAPGAIEGTIIHTDLKFTASDGTEYVLRDKIWDGHVEPGVCQSSTPGGALRGTVFVTKDGSGMTFVSDFPIQDTGFTTEWGPSGYLRMRDGTCYRFDYGAVTWIRDRNGNLVYSSNNTVGFVTSFKDALNRQVSVE